MANWIKQSKKNPNTTHPRTFHSFKCDHKLLRAVKGWKQLPVGDVFSVPINNQWEINSKVNEEWLYRVRRIFFLQISFCMFFFFFKSQFMLMETRFLYILQNEFLSKLQNVVISPFGGTEVVCLTYIYSMLYEILGGPNGSDAHCRTHMHTGGHVRFHPLSPSG